MSRRWRCKIMLEQDCYTYSLYRHYYFRNHLKNKVIMNGFPSKSICGLRISLQGLITFNCVHGHLPKKYMPASTIKILNKFTSDIVEITTLLSPTLKKANYSQLTSKPQCFKGIIFNTLTIVLLKQLSFLVGK